MARLWIRNLFENLALFPIRSVSDIGRADLPAVVAGAGESLEYAVPWIKKNRSQMKLFAVDTALGALLERQIHPDYVIVVESQIANYSDFLVDVAKQNKNIEFLVDITSSPSVLRKLPRNGYFFISEFGESELIDRLDSSDLGAIRIPALGSVGVVAIYLALAMTSGPVLMAGLDFSFRPGKTHARGTPTHHALLEKSNRITPVDTTHTTFARDPSPRRAMDGSVRYTNLVLDGYSQSVVGYALQSGRLYDTNNSSIMEEVAHLSSVEIDKIFDRGSEPSVESSGGKRGSRRSQSEVPISDDPRQNDVDASEPLESRIVDFLRDELARVRRARSECEANLRMSGSSSDPPALRDVDYLYFDFPDFEGSPANDRVFISRVIASALYYERVLLRALDLI